MKSASKRRYFEPVVLFGFAWHVAPPVAAFWHAVMLAYSQFSAPLAPLVQNFPVPVTWAVLLLLIELLPIVLLLFIDDSAALAIETPAIKVAMTAKAVKDFMMSLLGGKPRKAAPGQQEQFDDVPGTLRT